MKTKEDRAKEAWSNYEYREGFLYNTTFEDGYVIGATEQENLDIDKALECYCKASFCGINDYHKCIDVCGGCQEIRRFRQLISK